MGLCLGKALKWKQFTAYLTQSSETQLGLCLGKQTSVSQKETVFHLGKNKEVDHLRNFYCLAGCTTNKNTKFAGTTFF